MNESDPLVRIAVHQALGGGAVADLLLWRKRCGAALVLVSATILWFLFERAGYNLLSFLSNVLLLLVVILFLWAKSALLLNRPLPPIPNLEVPEVYVLKAADQLHVWINSALSIAREIAIGRNLKRLIQVASVLWILSYVGNLFNFLTLVYIGTLLSLSVPVLYERHQDYIDDKLCVIQTQCKRLDENFLKKIPRPMNKEKKFQ